MSNSCPVRSAFPSGVRSMQVADLTQLMVADGDVLVCRECCACTASHVERLQEMCSPGVAGRCPACCTAGAQRQQGRRLRQSLQELGSPGVGGGSPARLRQNLLGLFLRGGA